MAILIGDAPVPCNQCKLCLLSFCPSVRLTSIEYLMCCRDSNLASLDMQLVVVKHGRGLVVRERKEADLAQPRIRWTMTINRRGSDSKKSVRSRSQGQSRMSTAGIVSLHCVFDLPAHFVVCRVELASPGSPDRGSRDNLGLSHGSRVK